MAIFAYRARDLRGLQVSGEREAEDEDTLREDLSRLGMIPLSVKQMSQGFNAPWIKKLMKQGVGGNEILVMTRQFYTLFKAGMSMESIMSTLARQTDNKTLKETLQQVNVAIASGESLSKAFGKYPEIFGELYISMLSAGEEAGILEGVLGSLSELMEKEMKIKSSIKSATLYPKIVVFVLFMASIVIMNFVIPKFASFFAHYKSELPLPTRIMMAASNIVQNYWHVSILTVGTLVFLYNRYAKTRKGKVRVGKLRFKMPVFGPLNIKVANSRFCHILSALYRSGMPIHRCLEIAGATIENGAFQKEVELIRAEVTQGKSISDGMIQCHYFTPVIIDATAIGEKTGALDDMLEAMGNHYDVEVEHTIKNLTTLLEPMLLGGIFGMVAVFMLAIFLPIWNMSKVVSGH